MISSLGWGLASMRRHDESRSEGNDMIFRYGLNDQPPLWESILIGLQWCALLVPWIIILGTIAAGFHFGTEGERTVYLQKLFFVAAVFVLVEVLAGHRLPVVFGPSTVVLIGIITSQGFDTATIYTAVLIGSALLTACAVSGFFGTLRKLFTPRVVAVVLLLVAFCMMPTVVRLVTDATTGVPAKTNLLFALVLLLSMMTLHRFFRGVGRSTLIVSAMFTATVIHFMIFPGGFNGGALKETVPVASFFKNLTTSFSFDAGLILSFIVCYIALSINDLGSIQSMNALTAQPDMARRIDRGILITGLGNLAAGFLGVIGQVNYSLSLGVVLSSGCLSRWPLIPAAVILLAISFSPMAIAFLGNVPPVVIGGVLAYILSTQVAGGLTVLFGAASKPEFNDLLVVGMPLILAIAVAFLPGPAVESFPALIRPLAGNSFVTGVIAVLLLEHVIFRR
jgi:xanthine/uracil permease